MTTDWPSTIAISCYAAASAAVPNRTNVFTVDMSVEEIRWQAYQAVKSNTLSNYIELLKEMTYELEYKRKKLAQDPQIALNALKSQSQQPQGTQSNPFADTKINTNTATSGGAFGRTSTSSATSNPFGALNQTQAPGVSAFGQQRSQSQTTAFGGTSAFSTATPAQTGGFDNSTQSSAFGGTSAFGRAQPVTQNAAFGTREATQPSAFGGSTTQPAAFGGGTGTATAFGGTSTFGQPTGFDGASGSVQTTAFGAPQQQSQVSTFGGGQSNTQASVFGGQSTAQPTAFGASSGTFGGGNANNQPQSAAFGAQPVKGTAFEGQTQTQAQASPFGGSFGTSSFGVVNSGGGGGFGRSAFGKQQTPTSFGSEDPTDHEPDRDITPEEAAIFEAPAFVMYKVPEVAPPRKYRTT
eukprot:CFRG7424T1